MLHDFLSQTKADTVGSGVVNSSIQHSTALCQTNDDTGQQPSLISSEDLQGCG